MHKNEQIDRQTEEEKLAPQYTHTHTKNSHIFQCQRKKKENRIAHTYSPRHLLTGCSSILMSKTKQEEEEKMDFFLFRKKKKILFQKTNNNNNKKKKDKDIYIYV